LPYPRRDQWKCGDGKPSPYKLGREAVADNSLAQNGQ